MAYGTGKQTAAIKAGLAPFCFASKVSTSWVFRFPFLGSVDADPKRGSKDNPEQSIGQDALCSALLWSSDLIGTARIDAWAKRWFEPFGREANKA